MKKNKKEDLEIKEIEKELIKEEVKEPLNEMLPGPKLG